MTKQIRIQTNDPQKQNLTLVVKGFVKKFATIHPRTVRLNGSIDDTISQVITIVPEKEYPFQITDITARYGNDIKFDLEENQKNGQDEYQLQVTNIRQEAGRYSDTIVLKTDHPSKPELQIRVFGNIVAPKKPGETSKPADAVSPPKTDASGSTE